MRPRLASVAVMLMLLGLLSGCATSRMDLMRSHFGFRPDEPAIVTTDSSCKEYTEYVKYAQQLQEAYHSRATQNRGWLYVAGILGLGAAAASGALAAASAATVGTLALLAISGGFSAGAFATIDNSELAATYTAAANSVDVALKDADAELLKDPDPKLPTDSRYRDPVRCARALQVLRAGVSDTRVSLELRRTNNAAGALARAIAARNELDKVIQAAQPPTTDPTVHPAEVTLSAVGAETDVLVVGAPATRRAVSAPHQVTATLRDGGQRVVLRRIAAGAAGEEVTVTLVTAAGKIATITVK